MALPAGNSSESSLSGKQNQPVKTMREQAVFLERAKLLFANIPATIFATLIITPCLLFVNWELTDHTLLIAWFIYMIATMLFRLAIYLSHKKKGLNDNPEIWVKLFTFGTVLTALGWGIAGSSIILTDSLPQQMFTTTLLAGLSAGALATLTPFYSIFTLFILINLVPVTLTMLSFGTPYHYAISILLIIFITFILTASARMAKTIRESISLQFQHDDALKDLAEKNQQADELNRNLRQQISEREIIEQHLENSMSQLNATFESATDGILVIDNNEQITNFNQSFIDLFLIPETLIELEDFQQIQNHIGSLLKDKKSMLLKNDQDSTHLLELEDGRLIESYSNPQMIGDQVIGSVISYRDATMRINSESSLQAAKTKAEIANKEKSDFLSRISHELRTPLNAILGFGHLLQENINQHLDSDEKDFVSHICLAGEHLLHLIDDLLDISRIESGKLNINLSSVACEDIINESMSLVQPLAKDLNINISFKTKLTDMPYIQADHTRCKQALVNLLSNAIKYNHSNGSVTLTISVDNSHVRFEVTDTGIGIAEEDFKEIFQPFKRLKQIEKTKGTGIGLTITKRLIDVMNGSIGVSSEQGNGSTFWFELPKACEQETFSPIQSNEYKTGTINTTEKNHTILYVEDEPLNQALLKSIVNKMPNTRLIIAATGEEGIEIALTIQPDLILMDINLPGISGYDALKVIKNEKSFANTPVFALSANAMPNEIERGIEAGFFDYLIKPINIDSTRLLLSNTLSLIEN